MKLIALKQVKLIIKRCGLQKAVSREISFFLTYCLVRGYTMEMTKHFGFSYRAIAIKGRSHEFTSYLNIIRLSKEMDNFLKKHPGKRIERVLDNLMAEFGKIKHKIKQTEKLATVDPCQILKVISDLAPPYFKIIGLYNVFWRYLSLGNKLPESLTKRIAKERNFLADLYPRLDNYLSKYGKKIGDQLGFDGELISFLTLGEMQQFVKMQKINRKQLSELNKRRNAYFYLFIEDGKEIILTNPKIINDVCASCFPEKNISNVRVFHGQGAYPGKVRGTVYHLTDSKIRPTKDFILVTNMTHPKHTALIIKSLAVITDEGGILCHAAVACREFKKPCIIGTKIATQVLKDGDLVEVDANRGIVKIIK